MSIYVIGDLHLSFAVDKPMDIFGDNWENHAEKIRENWITKVKPEDTGNHDYWWSTVTKMRQFLKENNFENIDFLYNNSYLVEDKIIVGTRGWVTNFKSPENAKILNRENDRLKLSIEDGIRNYGEDKEIIAFIHYPPFFKEQPPDEFNFIKTLKDYGIRKCIYGHLHGESHNEAIEGVIDDIEYKLVSSDYLNFDLIKLI